MPSRDGFAEGDVAHSFGAGGTKSDLIDPRGDYDVYAIIQSELGPISIDITGIPIHQPGSLESALASAGFQAVSGDDLQLVFELASPEEYCEWLRDLTPPVRAMLADRSTEVVDRFWEAVTADAGRFMGSDGLFAIPNTAPMAVGAK